MSLYVVHDTLVAKGGFTRICVYLMLRSVCRLFNVCAVVLLVFGAASAEAVVIYDVVIDTSAISGSPGFLDVQFNPGNAASQNAKVKLSTFFTDGALDTVATLDGGASGALPGDLEIVNIDLLNGVYQGAIYANILRFSLEMSGSAIDSPDGTGAASTFSLAVLDDADAPLLTTDSFGSLLVIDLLPNGVLVPQTYPADASGSPSVVTLTLRAPGSAPLPPTVVLLVFGLFWLWFARQRATFRTAPAVRRTLNASRCFGSCA